MESGLEEQRGSGQLLQRAGRSACLALFLLIPGHTAAQATPDPFRVTTQEVGLWAGVAVVGLTALAVGQTDAPGCGPCNRADVPFFDRWAITHARALPEDASTALVLGLAGAASVALLRRGHAGWSDLRALNESAGLAAVLALVLKDATARHRPWTFTTDALMPDNGLRGGARNSFPSGHVAVAAAVTTSLLLSRSVHPSPLLRAVAIGAVALTGGLRIVAGRHFPSDVVAGAGLGVLSAVGVHAIRF